MSRWFLYVDESGKFEKQSDAVAVAGFLVDATVPGARRPELRRALQRLLPDGVGWPPHAAHCHFVAYHVQAVDAQREAAGRSRDSGDIAQAAAAIDQNLQLDGCPC